MEQVKHFPAKIFLTDISEKTAKEIWRKYKVKEDVGLVNLEDLKERFCPGIVTLYKRRNK